MFLTGHTGFKGGWMSLWLQRLGAVVTGYALKPAVQPNLFEAVNVGKGMRSIIGDIRDGAKLASALLESNAEVVIHMAAQPLVRRSYADPVETYSTNVMGTVLLLEAVRQCESVRAVVNVTTDKCYENREWLWPYRENEPLGGYDPYSSSKGCAELVTASYRNSFFKGVGSCNHPVALASARAGNVIGGGDWSEHRLVPDVLSAFSRGEEVLIRNPDAIRPWQHVLEPLRGYLMLAERLFTAGAPYAEPFNFGPHNDDCRSVEFIVRQLASKSDGSGVWRIVRDNNMHEASFLKLDISKAANRLSWHPLLQLDAALQLTVDWYQAFQAGSEIHDFTIDQIDSYQSLMQPSE